MEGKMKQREAERKAAADRLKEAREREVNLRNQVTRAIEGLSETKNRLADAQSNLAKVEAQFKKLGEERLELLNYLKNQVSGLVIFFNSILEEVGATVDNEVKDFLERIERGITTQYKSPDFTKEISLSNRAKQRIRNTALQIQGSFSGIRDITATYVKVSDMYITPAIDTLQVLSATRGKEWDAQSDDCIRWCRKSMDEIQAVTRAAADDVEPHMLERTSSIC
ncbi:hypothetical protein VTH82DRAFT_658 [Thermothelomyces myriococcoides]